jgi:hypothetical protein
MKKSDSREQSREHARRMFAWELRVAKDKVLTKSNPTALHVIVLLRDKMPVCGGFSADQAWIAGKIGSSTRTTRNVIAALERRGHLRVLSGRQRGVANHYLPPSQPGIGNVLPTLSGSETRFPPGRQLNTDRGGSGLPTSNHLSSRKFSIGSQPIGKGAIQLFEEVAEIAGLQTWSGAQVIRAYAVAEQWLTKWPPVVCVHAVRKVIGTRKSDAAEIQSLKYFEAAIEDTFNNIPSKNHVPKLNASSA